MFVTARLGETKEVPKAGDGSVSVAIKSSRVSVEDLWAISGRSLINSARGVAGTTGVGSVVASGCPGISEGVSVFVVGNGTWNDRVTISGERVFVLPNGIPAEAAAHIDVVASAFAIFRQNGVKSGDTVCVDVLDEALTSALSAVAKHMSVKVTKPGAKLDNVNLVVTSASGDAFSKIAKQIQNGGTVLRVNSALPVDSGVQSGAGAYIFQNKSISGFDFHVLAQTNPTVCAQVVNDAAALLAEKKVDLPSSKTFPQSDFAASIKAAQSGKSSVLSISK